ncbi:MAG: ComEA family DNA-binding protein [Armatimonadetes bacterium]|nr:ComEA family DNA-binding protein [Armatimonadota bacterium]
MFRLSRREQLAAVFLLAAGLMGLLVGFYRSGSSASAQADMVFEEPPAVLNQPPVTNEPPAPPEPAEVVVHVAGAVRKPEVYHLSPGSRVSDALKAAGGATSRADLDRINLAARLDDGEQVVIPDRDSAPLMVAKGEESAPSKGKSSKEAKKSKSGSGKKKIASPEEGQVNINTAGSEELQRLPGIGPAIAGRILDYRKANGPFRRIEDLQEVKGIGPKKFAKMKDLIKV